LASVEGMNHFAACLLLHHCSLHEFLELDPETRFDAFGSLVGHSRMVGCSLSPTKACLTDMQAKFNQVMADRYGALEEACTLDTSEHNVTLSSPR
jgi:hypothetical protein